MKNLKDELIRKRLVSTIVPAVPMSAVFWEENCDSYFRTPIMAMNSYEIKSYNSVYDFDGDCPCEVDFEFQFIPENPESFESAEDCGNFVCYEYAHKLSTEALHDMNYPRKSKLKNIEKIESLIVELSLNRKKIADWLTARGCKTLFDVSKYNLELILKDLEKKSVKEAVCSTR